MTNQMDEIIVKDETIYTAPAIILEIDLETRAGSVRPSGIDPLDLTGLGSDDAP